MTVAFTLPGNISVHAFSLLIGAGASLGLSRFLGSMYATSGRLLATGFTALLGALFGGLLAYRAVHPAAGLATSLGGLSWAGSLFGGLFGGLAAARLLRLPLAQTIDGLVPLALILAISAWLGCWLDGCAYGAPSTAGYALPSRDEWGNISDRAPLQLAGAGLALLTLVIHDLFRSRRPLSGLPGGLGLLATGLQLWWLSGLRADPGPALGGIRLDLWAAWAVCAAGLITAGLSLSHHHRSHRPTHQNR